MASSEQNLATSTSTTDRNLRNGYPRISPSSPVRDLGPGQMDYKRCAALHNELLTRAVRGCGVEMPLEPRTWWEANAPSEEIANMLHPSLIEFLKRAYVEDVMPGHAPFFFFLGALNPPDSFRNSPTVDSSPGRFIKLYECSEYRHGDDEGLLFDQQTLKATFIEDYNDTSAVCSRDWGWMPLEVIFDSYLQMIDERKVEAVYLRNLGQVECEFNSENDVEPWIIHQYTKSDVTRAATAFERLVEAIDSRIEHKDDSTVMDLPWHNSATLSQDFIPPSSFAYEFLQAISHWKVRFSYVAPGIRFPTMLEFLDQPITDFVTSPYNHLGKFPGNCPLRIFQIDAEQPVHDRKIGLPNLPAGFYIHPVAHRYPRTWTNGCRLILPFSIGANGWARLSNGEPFGRVHYYNSLTKPCNEHGSLYQAGLTDGITNGHLVQIDKVLNNWADRVEAGDWEVTEEGVAGGIEKFRDADTEEHWQKYWIPLSW